MNKIAELLAHPEPIINSSQYRVRYGKIFYDFSFIEKLRIEKLRAQRSNSTLSIILLTLNKESDSELIYMREILDIVRTKTRVTDTSGFVDHKTIGVLLPYTDEKGAKEVCEKLINGKESPQFSASISSYPDDIFESLAKIGSIQPDAHPFELKDSRDDFRFKLLLKRGFDIAGSIIGMLSIHLHQFYQSSLTICTRH